MTLILVVSGVATTMSDAERLSVDMCDVSKFTLEYDHSHLKFASASMPMGSGRQGYLWAQC
jgi:hypothetical protein